VSTPRSVDVPAGVRRITLQTERGPFAAFEAMPATGVRERSPALLVPGFTGSKEDFLPIIRQLGAAGRRVVAIDIRGQFETQGSDNRAVYRLEALGADIGAVADTMLDDPGETVRGLHLLGHSFGGLVARETVLAKATDVGSLTLMSSGPGALTGPAAAVLSAVLEPLRGFVRKQLAVQVRRLWEFQLAAQAKAEGTPQEIIEFLGRRMLLSNPDGLVATAEQLLDCPDRTDELAEAAAQIPILVLYGEYDDKWQTPVQEEMAERLGAERVCIPGATHSPAVEAPETTASALNTFWNAAESLSR
jgi:pimeloyl-ACP methyl ester carboxylesterase